MNSRIQIWCIWCAPAATVLYILAFWGIAGYVPPTAPGISTADLVSFYASHRDAIRLGQLLGMIFCILYIPWYAVLSAQIARIEKGFPILALIQFGGGLVLVVYFLFCGLLWNIAAYRPELHPELLRLIHDASWLGFVMIFPEYTLQLVVIAVAGFMDKREQPLLPRWACYYNLWAAATGFGGGMATFFKTGPFAYNGLFAFWMPVAFYVLWLCIMVPLLLRAVRRQALEPVAAT